MYNQKENVPRLKSTILISHLYFIHVRILFFNEVQINIKYYILFSGTNWRNQWHDQFKMIYYTGDENCEKATTYYIMNYDKYLILSYGYLYYAKNIFMGEHKFLHEI